MDRDHPGQTRTEIGVQRSAFHARIRQPERPLRSGLARNRSPPGAVLE